MNRFTRWWILAFVSFVAFFSSFNALVDPYLLFDMPRLKGFNFRKPAADTQQHLMKAYDVLRAEPKTLILGSSRAALGLDAESSAWPLQRRPVYNLAFFAGSPYQSYRYLQHVTSERLVSLVVFGLEFEHFLDQQGDMQGDFEAHLRVRRDGNPNDRHVQYMRDLFQGAFSLVALQDSVETLIGNFRADSSDLEAGSWHWGFLDWYVAELGAYGVIASYDVFYSRWYVGRRRDPVVMTYLQSILELCRSRNVPIILFISPSYVDQLELLQLVGDGQAWEDWQRELAALADKYGVPLWDFSGYDSYSTEPIPGGRNPLHWFSEPDHYTRALGDMIISRIFGGGDAHFGTLITTRNIDTHLQGIRRQRQRYHEERFADAHRIHDLFYMAVKELPQVTSVRASPVLESRAQ